MARASRGSELPEKARVLVVETGLLGELLVITPALRALKKARPGSRVTVITRPESAQVLVGNPHVDRMLPLPKSERAGLLGLMRTATWIRAQRFDAALVLHTSFRSALLVWLAGVPLRAGLSCEGRGLFLSRRTPRDRSAYEVDEHLRVLELVGVPADGRALEIHLSGEEVDAARRALAEAGAASATVALHPGASRAHRRWPAERFAELGARLASELGETPVFLFGPRERDLAAAVERWYDREGLPSPSVVLPRSARELAAVLGAMKAAVTNNTGPMHIAAAVGVPGVFIHGPTPVRRWHPPGDRYVPVFAEDVPCRPCCRPTCAEPTLACMEAVTVERVLAAVAGLLGEEHAAGSGRAAGSGGEAPRE